MIFSVLNLLFLLLIWNVNEVISAHHSCGMIDIGAEEYFEDSSEYMMDRDLNFLAFGAQWFGANFPLAIDGNATANESAYCNNIYAPVPEKGFFIPIQHSILFVCEMDEEGFSYVMLYSYLGYGCQGDPVETMAMTHNMTDSSLFSCDNYQTSADLDMNDHTLEIEIRHFNYYAFHDLFYNATMYSNTTLVSDNCDINATSMDGVSWFKLHVRMGVSIPLISLYDLYASSFDPDYDPEDMVKASLTVYGQDQICSRSFDENCEPMILGTFVVSYDSDGSLMPNVTNLVSANDFPYKRLTDLGPDNITTLEDVQFEDECLSVLVYTSYDPTLDIWDYNAISVTINSGAYEMDCSTARPTVNPTPTAESKASPPVITFSYFSAFLAIITAVGLSFVV